MCKMKDEVSEIINQVREVTGADAKKETEQTMKWGERETEERDQLLAFQFPAISSLAPGTWHHVCGHS